MGEQVIHIRIDRADGTLPRLIGLVERRGFHIHGLKLADDGPEWRRVELVVRGREGRSIDNLGRQIDRLFGVDRVTGETETDGPRQASVLAPVAA